MMQIGAPILDVVGCQLREQNPPETSETYNRLRLDGYTDDQAKRMIGHVIAQEVSQIIRHHKPYSSDRFARALRELPSLDFSCY